MDNLITIAKLNEIISPFSKLFDTRLTIAMFFSRNLGFVIVLSPLLTFIVRLNGLLT